MKKGVCGKIAEAKRGGGRPHRPPFESATARGHKLLRQTSELVMVDAAGGLDKQRHRLYLFLSPTAAGGVPIGAIITNSEQELVFEAALKDLMECFPAESFYGHGFPTLSLKFVLKMATFGLGTSS